MISKPGEGSVYRTRRIVGGLGFLSLLILAPVPGWGLVGLAGLILLVTGITGLLPDQPAAHHRYPQVSPAPADLV